MILSWAQPLHLCLTLTGSRAMRIVARAGADSDNPQRSIVSVNAEPVSESDDRGRGKAAGVAFGATGVANSKSPRESAYFQPMRIIVCSARRLGLRSEAVALSAALTGQAKSMRSRGQRNRSRQRPTDTWQAGESISRRNRPNRAKSFFDLFFGAIHSLLGAAILEGTVQTVCERLGRDGREWRGRKAKSDTAACFGPT